MTNVTPQRDRMTSLHLLQLSKCPTQAKRQILAHAQADDDIGFPRSIAMLGNCSKAHANKPFLVEELGEQINVQRLDAFVEDHDPVAVVSYFADCSRHWNSLRETGFEQESAA